MSTSTAYRRRRRAGWALAGLALALGLGLTAVPAVRVMAYDVLRQIGVFSLTDGQRQAPVDANEPRGLPDPTSTPIPPDRPASLTTLEQVSAEAGFEPLVPAYLPEGYAFDQPLALEYLDDAGRSEGMGTVLSYRLASDATHYLEVNQTRFNDDRPREFPVGDNPIQDVTVRGRPGVWLEQAALEAPDSPQPERRNILLWEEEGFMYSLVSDALPLDQLLQVAESLHN